MQISLEKITVALASYQSVSQKTTLSYSVDHLKAMTKAQKFHEWFTHYLGAYDSTVFKSKSQAEAFNSITQSAASIRSSGN